jgi:hypothetical protein
MLLLVHVAGDMPAGFVLSSGARHPPLPGCAHLPRACSSWRMGPRRSRSSGQRSPVIDRSHQMVESSGRAEKEGQHSTSRKIAANLCF